VSTRTRAPGADLRLQYKRVFLASTALAAVLLAITGAAYPTYEAGPAAVRMDQIVITMESIPETRQMDLPPPAPRPAVPLEAEADEVPEDVTIESTDLEFERAPLDLPAPPLFVQSPGEFPEEEEALELWLVEEQPRLIKHVTPDYPRAARRSGLEGSVFLKVLVDRNGKVIQASVLRGEDVFHRPAVDAAYQFVFTPAYQNDKPVKVWMVIPMEFRLAS
jgi:protein TonB